MTAYFLENMSMSKADALTCPSEVYEGGIRHTLTYRTRTSRGGDGMGEYPATLTCVLSNGHVYKWDEWIGKAERVDAGAAEQQEISF